MDEALRDFSVCPVDTLPGGHVELSMEKDRPSIEYACACYARGDLDEALAAAGAALHAVPESARAHGILGKVLLARGEYHQAIDHFRQALMIEPVQEPDLWNDLGEAVLASGEGPERFGLEELIRHAIRATGESPHLCVALGIALLNAGNAAGARDAFLVGIEQHHRELSRGGLLAAIQRWIMAALPGMTNAHYFLGHALNELGDRQGARVEWRRVVKMGQGDRLAQRALDLLQRYPESVTPKRSDRSETEWDDGTLAASTEPPGSKADRWDGSIATYQGNPGGSLPEEQPCNDWRSTTHSQVY